MSTINECDKFNLLILEREEQGIISLQGLDILDGYSS